MGANSTQAAGLLVFLLAFVVLAADLASGGNLVLSALGLGMLGLSAGIFLRARPWEHQEG